MWHTAVPPRPTKVKGSIPPDGMSFSTVPAKSGVGGGIIGMLPGVGGLAVFSPRLDEHGHSVRGLRVFEALSTGFDMHLFDPDRPWHRGSMGQ